jgi:hypothetical protein
MRRRKCLFAHRAPPNFRPLNQGILLYDWDGSTVVGVRRGEVPTPQSSLSVFQQICLEELTIIRYLVRFKTPHSRSKVEYYDYCIAYNTSNSDALPGTIRI